VSARNEAQARIGDGYVARVLEPSPPADESEPWFADDPVARGDAGDGIPVVSPVGTGDLRWDDLVAGDPDLAPWCADRWLGAFRRLGLAPARLGETRRSLHRVAECVVAPARTHANSKIGLRYTRGGFGTPFFSVEKQVRVEGADIVVASGGQERRAPVSTIGAAARLLGPDLLPVDAACWSDELPLVVDPAAAAFLGDWFGFSFSVLEELRAGAAPGLEPGRVQLWPEHFDPALELGAEAGGVRAAYGCSPGDDVHPEPYLYVAPWTARPKGDLWNATAFAGAELPFSALPAAGDQRAAALAFFSQRCAALTAG